MHSTDLHLYASVYFIPETKAILIFYKFYKKEKYDKHAREIFKQKNILVKSNLLKRVGFTSDSATQFDVGPLLIGHSSHHIPTHLINSKNNAFHKGAVFNWLNVYEKIIILAIIQMSYQYLSICIQPFYYWLIIGPIEMAHVKFDCLGKVFFWGRENATHSNTIVTCCHGWKFWNYKFPRNFVFFAIMI